MNDNPIISWIGNSVSLGMIISAFLGWLPAIGATIAIIWYSIEIYESKTVQRYLEKRLRNRLLKLHSEAAHLELVLSEKNDFETKEQIKHLAKIRTEIDYNINSLADKREAKAEAKAEAAIASVAEEKIDGTRIDTL